MQLIQYQRSKVYARFTIEVYIKKANINHYGREMRNISMVAQLQENKTITKRCRFFHLPHHLPVYC